MIRAVIEKSTIEVETKNLVIKLRTEDIKRLGVKKNTRVKLLSPNQEKSQFDCSLIIEEVLPGGEFGCKFDSSIR